MPPKKRETVTGTLHGQPIEITSENLSALAPEDLAQVVVETPDGPMRPGRFCVEIDPIPDGQGASI